MDLYSQSTTSLFTTYKRTKNAKSINIEVSRCFLLLLRNSYRSPFDFHAYLLLSASSATIFLSMSSVACSPLPPYGENLRPLTCLHLHELSLSPNLGLIFCQHELFEITMMSTFISWYVDSINSSFELVLYRIFIDPLIAVFFLLYFIFIHAFFSRTKLWPQSDLSVVAIRIV